MTRTLEVVCFFGGIVAIVRGAWMVYPPAGWIVGGLVALALGLVMAREPSGSH